MSARFAADGSVEFAGEVGTWTVERGHLRVTTRAWQCEGVIDLATVFLLCVHGGSVAERVDLELQFSEQPGDG